MKMVTRERKMKYLSTPPLLLLPILILLSILLPLHAENVRKCYVCTERDSPKCSGELSPSDTSLIQECPVGIGSKGIPKGCQIFGKKRADFTYPKKDLIWRDCLYSTDIAAHGLEFTHKDDDPQWWWMGTSHAGNVQVMNDKRKQLELPPLPMYDMSLATGRSFVRLYYHPNPLPELWNLSNGMSIVEASDGDFRLPEARNVTCFVCTDADPGCQDNLTSSSHPQFIKDCVGSPETTVAVGCQIIIGQYDYPGRTYFYRDCLYQDYIKCHNKEYKRVILKQVGNSYWVDGFVFRLREWVNCMNSVRTYLGLPHYSVDRIPDKDSRPVTVLYYKPFKWGEWARGQGEVIKRTDQPDLSNGEAIAGLRKQPTPPDFKIRSPFKCGVCDSRQAWRNKWSRSSCDWYPDRQYYPPTEWCDSPTDDAYGCLMLYEEDDDGKTKWARRDCWYKGDLYCLKGLGMSPSGRSMSPACTKPKAGGKCNARVLIREGRRVAWNGSREFRTREEYDEFRNCVRNIRLEQNVSDSLPEYPEFDPSGSGAPKVFHYSFCAGEEECNGQGSPNFVELPETTLPPTTLPPTTKSPTSFHKGKGGDPCQPREDFDDDQCDDPGFEGEGWWRGIRWILYGGAIIITIWCCAIATWMWIMKKRGGFPVAPDLEEVVLHEQAAQTISQETLDSPELNQQSSAHSQVMEGESRTRVEVII